MRFTCAKNKVHTYFQEIPNEKGPLGDNNRDGYFTIDSSMKRNRGKIDQYDKKIKALTIELNEIKAEGGMLVNFKIEIIQKRIAYNQAQLKGAQEKLVLLEELKQKSEEKGNKVQFFEGLSVIAQPKTFLAHKRGVIAPPDKKEEAKVDVLREMGRKKSELDSKKQVLEDQVIKEKNAEDVLDDTQKKIDGEKSLEAKQKLIEDAIKKVDGIEGGGKGADNPQVAASPTMKRIKMELILKQQGVKEQESKNRVQAVASTRERFTTDLMKMFESKPEAKSFLTKEFFSGYEEQSNSFLEYLSDPNKAPYPEANNYNEKLLEIQNKLVDIKKTMLSTLQFPENKKNEAVTAFYEKYPLEEGENKKDFDTLIASDIAFQRNIIEKHPGDIILNLGGIETQLSPLDFYIQILDPLTGHIQRVYTLVAATKVVHEEKNEIENQSNELRTDIDELKEIEKISHKDRETELQDIQVESDKISTLITSQTMFIDDTGFDTIGTTDDLIAQRYMEIGPDGMTYDIQIKREGEKYYCTINDTTIPMESNKLNDMKDEMQLYTRMATLPIFRNMLISNSEKGGTFVSELFLKFQKDSQYTKVNGIYDERSFMIYVYNVIVGVYNNLQEQDLDIGSIEKLNSFETDANTISARYDILSKILKSFVDSGVISLNGKIDTTKWNMPQPQDSFLAYL